MNTLFNLLIRTRPCLLQQCLVTLRQSNQLTHLFHLILWTKIIQSVWSLSLSILVEKTRRIYVLGFLFFHTLLRTFYHTDPNQFRPLLLPTLTLHSPQPLLAYLVMNPLLLLFLLPLKNRYSILRVQVLRILTNLPPHHFFSHNPTVRVNPTIFLQHLNLIQQSRTSRHLLLINSTNTLRILTRLLQLRNWHVSSAVLMHVHTVQVFHLVSIIHRSN